MMLGVGTAATAYSWSHVLDLARVHGEGGWKAWVVALVIETAAVSLGLEVRRRRREGQRVWFVVGALVVAIGLQLAAQLAMAPADVWGWVLAALPAVAFLVLIKTALAKVTADAVASASDSKTAKRKRIRVRPSASESSALALEPTALGDARGASESVSEQVTGRMRSDEELRAELDALFATGAPVSCRRVQSELHVGQARAKALLDAREASASEAAA
jgi:hypothetical protein